MVSKLEITPEILSKASEYETVEEIQNKAKEFGKDITSEQAQRLFDLSHASGAVGDEELDKISGGMGCGGGPRFYTCKYCSTIIQLPIEKKHITDCHPEKLSEYLAKPHYEPGC